ncbi:MAG: VWA domain-containing protein [Chitinophagaceae bacterium]|nr:VWA domain-containing protein [Chitinophagaceae bacterium]
MKPTSKLLSTLIITAAALGTMAFSDGGKKRQKSKPRMEEKPKIQAAILLDVSNSMDGLIEQAKAQLWNMVSVMGKAKCDNDQAPQIEIALYEYGRSTNAVSDGYVKQISPFTTDLDKLSQQLFTLTTNGGDEYCGQVIFTSLNQLNWDAGNGNYKVIFIAGNEDFLQGNLNYTRACAEAKKKGVVVNTIYCGSRMDGIKEHWNLNAECGAGSFTNINSNARIEEIPTPYDSILFSLNDKLNGTYIAYGYAGAGKQLAQASMDMANTSMSKSAGLKRAAVKGNKNLYKNDSWDLVDRGDIEKTDEFLVKLDKKTLPDSLQMKSTEELKKVIAVKKQERGLIQRSIETANAQREAYIAAEKKKNAVKNNEATLETEVEKMIKVQAKRYNMRIN